MRTKRHKKILQSQLGSALILIWLIAACGETLLAEGGSYCTQLRPI